MHQSFTGSSRRTRQVNLSGRRTTNPFVNPGQGTSAALASAQQEREKRQRERDRLNATKLIQRSWRGYRSRKRQSHAWRQDWDAREAHGAQDQPYTQEEDALSQVRLLLQFANPRNDVDIERLRFFLSRLSSSVSSHRDFASGTDGPWPMTYLRLQRLLLAVIENALQRGSKYAGDPVLFQSLGFIVERIPALSAKNSRGLYRTLGRFMRIAASNNTQSLVVPAYIVNCALVPLKDMSVDVLAVYEAFACEILSLDFLSRPPLAPSVLPALAEGVNYKILANAIRGLLESSNSHGYETMSDPKSLAYILAHLIYFYRQTHDCKPSSVYTDDRDYLHVVSSLMSAVAGDSSAKRTTKGNFMDEESESVNLEVVQNDPFVQEQVFSLVDGDNISRLLGGSEGTSTLTEGGGRMGEHATQLASFALTLIRFFPRKGDDIRIHLYKSSTGAGSNTTERLPAVKYFWQATKNTKVFRAISQSLDNAVPLLKPKRSGLHAALGLRPTEINPSVEAIQDDWRIILVFFELFTFVLRLMDDEEFFSPASPVKAGSSTGFSQNALPLDDVKALTIFLKNLGFAMYFNALALSGAEGEKVRETGSISSYFNLSASSQEQRYSREKPAESTVAGIAGVATEYVKGIVTGLLRMLYERDSRRPFLPKGHWLMTYRLDMEGFISSVVMEDEKRRQIQEEEDQESQPEEEEDEENDRDNVVGTGHSSRLRQQEKLRRQHRRHARTRFLQAVAPRLEILQNMPFFIPFETRVQIFREFVRLDQLMRRGTNDPDVWRFSGMSNPDSLRRHHARIRRDHILTDAFDQFQPLGQGLKEPIQITFVDAFGSEEAGIDGGGVTKEFLTSITKEAFNTSGATRMFVENDHHLLYPNPTILEELKELHRITSPNDMLSHNGQQLSGPEVKKTVVQAKIDEFDFLGRIIGKCLYEGILVDVSFAGFFLLKWALTGGDGSAPKESGYRANLNDLRDLDEGLYQGLLQLKNYPGDVSDFGLDFTITDSITVHLPNGKTVVKNLTRDLKRGGSNMPVTNENRLVYISYVARHRLQVQPGPQTSAFLMGLSSMIKPSWLNMFNQSEIQTLIGGTSSSIDVDDLRRNTQYGGVYVIGDDGEEHPTVKMFWEVLEGMTDEERRAVLKFVTSTPRAPLLGFGSLNPKFSIRDSGSDTTRLPSTSTCVNLLKLPIFKEARTMKEKLLMAVFSGAGFDLS